MTRMLSAPPSPLELADAVLEETRAAEQRLRVLPSRAGIYFVLALGLFPGLAAAGLEYGVPARAVPSGVLAVVGMDRQDRWWR